MARVATHPRSRPVLLPTLAVHLSLPCLGGRPCSKAFLTVSRHCPRATPPTRSVFLTWYPSAEPNRSPPRVPTNQNCRRDTSRPFYDPILTGMNHVMCHQPVAVTGCTPAAVNGLLPRASGSPDICCSLGLDFRESEACSRLATVVIGGQPIRRAFKGHPVCLFPVFRDCGLLHTSLSRSTRKHLVQGLSARGRGRLSITRKLSRVDHADAFAKVKAKKLVIPEHFPRGFIQTIVRALFATHRRFNFSVARDFVDGGLRRRHDDPF